MKEVMDEVDLKHLAPFGAEITARRPEADLRAIPAAALHSWTAEHKVVVLRGFASLAGAALPDFCRGLGDLLEWDFGFVNELRVQDGAQNYLFTDHAVPFHWDGAFAGRIPHYIFFVCDSAPPESSGGETLFCDTTRVVTGVSAEQARIWQNISITYSTEKIVHYGGAFTSELIAGRPITGEKILRYAEPVEDLNPVRLDIKGIPEAAHAAFLEDMHLRLHDPGVCYRHQWVAGDILIADNFALLHGRAAFTHPAARQIRRVNIL